MSDFQNLPEVELCHLNVFRTGRCISEFLDNTFILQKNKLRHREVLHKAAQKVSGRTRTPTPGLSKVVLGVTLGHPPCPVQTQVSVWVTRAPVTTNRLAPQPTRCAAEKNLWALQ